MKLKKILPTFAVLFCCACAFSQGLLRNVPGRQTLGSNNIIAIVEDRVITREEVMKEIEPFVPQIKAASRSEFDFNKKVNDYINEIVQSMIDRELIVKDFKSKGMTIPESYMDTYFDDYIKREFNGDRAEFIKFIQSQGKTIKQFRADQEKEVILGYMQNQKRQSAAEISPQKIKDYYEANKAKWYSPSTANISMITLKKGMYASMDDNRKVAAEIMEKLKQGEKFSDLARKYSKDDSSAKGGEWGWYKKGELNPVFDSKVFALEPGQTTDPIESGEMIIILKVEEKKPEGVRSIDDVREQIEWDIIEQNGKISYQKWLESLRKKAYIKYFK